MVPLKTNKRILTWLCVCPSHESTSKRKNVAMAIFALSVFTINVLALISPVVFFRKSMSVDLEGSLYALYQIAACSSVTYAMIINFIRRNEINGIFGQLSDIQESLKDESSYRFLVRANNQSERMWRIYFKFMAGILINISMTAVISVLYSLFAHGHFDATLAYYPYRYVTPWDQQTPIGYFAIILFSNLAAQAYLLTNGITLLLFISICLQHRAFYKVVEHSLRKLDYKDGKRLDKESLCKLIRFHMMIKDWFSMSSKVYSPLVLIQLIGGMIFLASTLFQVDLHLHPFDIGVILLLLGAAVSTSNLFLYCFFGKIATDSYAKMADRLYETDWHELPIELQKYFILMIANMQKPLHYHGFRVAILDLQTFSEFLRTVFTYYMMFKTLTSH